MISVVILLEELQSISILQAIQAHESIILLYMHM